MARKYTRDGAMFVLQRYESIDPELYKQCVDKKYEEDQPYQGGGKKWEKKRVVAGRDK